MLAGLAGAVTSCSTLLQDDAVGANAVAGLGGDEGGIPRCVTDRKLAVHQERELDERHQQDDEDRETPGRTRRAPARAISDRSPEPSSLSGPRFLRRTSPLRTRARDPMLRPQTARANEAVVGVERARGTGPLGGGARGRHARALRAGVDRSCPMCAFRSGKLAPAGGSRPLTAFARSDLERRLAPASHALACLARSGSPGVPTVSSGRRTSVARAASLPRLSCGPETRPESHCRRSFWTLVEVRTLPHLAGHLETGRGAAHDSCAGCG